MESFIFYQSFWEAIKRLPTLEEKWRAISMLMELGFYEIEPDLEKENSDSIYILYKVCEKQIKASLQHKIDGQKGGQAKAKGAKKNISTPLKNNFYPPTYPPTENSSSNVNVNGNVNLNENVNEDSSSSSLSLYSNQIFTIMSEAGLPCCKNNAVTFMQTDFKNAMSYLHNTSEYQHIHSDDVIGAVNNYVQVLSDNNCYLKGKMNFFSLVKSKIFYNLLPSNFDINNFLDYKKKGEETPEKKKKVYDGYNPCPDCGHYKLVTVDDKGNAVCDHCGRKVTFDEIMAMPPVTGLPHIEE